MYVGQEESEVSQEKSAGFQGLLQQRGLDNIPEGKDRHFSLAYVHFPRRVGPRYPVVFLLMLLTREMPRPRTNGLKKCAFPWCSIYRSLLVSTAQQKWSVTEEGTAGGRLALGSWLSGVLAGTCSCDRRLQSV